MMQRALKHAMSGCRDRVAHGKDFVDVG